MGEPKSAAIQTDLQVSCHRVDTIAFHVATAAANTELCRLYILEYCYLACVDKS